MNIKPNISKITGVENSSMRHFLLSLIATTVSIALTFGTAAIIDYNKKQQEKHEIVMMVMYDMYNTLQSVAHADSMIRLSMDLQRQIAEDTTLFNVLKYQFTINIPRIDYTETTEHIFSSNIETINTVGNVLFTENVAEFYQQRHFYKTNVCDTMMLNFQREAPYESVQRLLDYYDYFYTAIMSRQILLSMQNRFLQCQQMMNISDEEIEAYREKRRELNKSTIDEDSVETTIFDEVKELQQKIDDARKKNNL
ncbi:MAG: hypothetical protein Q4E32_04985 [Bacteroidales bacterium]|nr:hypothetical protein [Bacteroidales bacterium]